MGILVCYDDFTYDVVSDNHLEYLVMAGCIVGYDNSGEWVKLEDSAHTGEKVKLPIRATATV